MTTLLSSPLPPCLDLDEWDALGETDERLELVDGYVIVVPSEQWRNVEAQALFIERVRDATGRTLRCGSQMSVVLQDVPATVRQPDIVVLRRDIASGSTRLRADDVLLAAEIVSPSSVETDWLTKRREYAAAGIPHYVVVDLRDGHRRITLFRSPGPDGYTDITGGTHITLTLGEHQLTIGLADLTG
ncbi:Uma2 family endonuclease [Mobilicoccus massiliensis]|uniref:Uma2 family endonuclease n=1 Tax=Mobilicoccus massiliensis TaxID=1522310 RepID=UPI0006935A7C|nr:Uma2 family endonuclease [Mobilicoccus massiliensis]